MNAQPALDPTCEPSAESECPDSPEDPELDDLVVRFEHRVHFFAYRVERRFGIDPQWRDDLVSSGYWGLLKALRNRRRNAHDRELSAYVSKRVEGAIIDEARRSLNRSSVEEEFDPASFEQGQAAQAPCGEWNLDLGQQPGPEELADRQHRWETIDRSIKDLGGDHRKLLMAYAAGCSLAEIARLDGTSPARLQSQMSKIGRTLRARAPELRRLLLHEA